MSIPLWVRRSLCLRVVPGFIVAALVLINSNTGWSMDWGWASLQASMPMLLVGPLLAGIVAHERARRFEPSLLQWARTTPRGRRALVGLAGGSLVWALASWIVALAWVAIACLGDGAAGAVDLWVFVEVPVYLVLAASFGLLMGSVNRGILIGPLAAVVFYLADILGDQMGVGGIFRVATTLGSMLDLERNPSYVLAALAVHISTALLFVAGAMRWSFPVVRRRASWVQTGVFAVCTILGLINFMVVHDRGDVFRRATDPERCADGTVRVCGPSKALPLSEVAARDLSVAVDGILAGSGISWAQRYSWSSTSPFPSDSGLLMFDLEGMSGGHLSRWDVASTLSTPRLCSALFSAVDAPPLLEQQKKVHDWIVGRMEAASGAGNVEAPASVREAYSILLSCPLAERMP